MGIRQVPSRLEPELRGFLQDLRNEVSRVGGDSFKYVLLGDMRTALSGDFLKPGDIGRIIDSVQDGIREDPFWQDLGSTINLINGPPTLPGSIQSRLDDAQDTVTNLMSEADAQLEAGIAANGSAIVTLQTVTAGQATQITALGSRMGDSESKVAMLMSTTPTEALWWTGLSTDVANTKNSVAMLMSTTPEGALWWSGLKSQSDAATSNVSMLMSSTPTGASWWAGLSTDTANSKSNIAMLMSTTPTGASWWSGLKTQVDNNSSQIVTLNTTSATQGQSIQQLNNKTNGNSASIETLQTVTNGLSAEYSVRLDVNNRVAGFGLYNHGGSSAFYVRADKFAVGDASTGDRIPFIVQDGTVYIDTVLIRNASIDSAKIADATITNAKIQDAAITSAKIADATISSAKIQDAAITNAKIDSLDAAKVTFGQMHGDRINVGTLYADRIVSNTIAQTVYYNQSGTRPANGQTQDLALGWGYAFRASPGTPVILKLELGMATAVSQWQVYWDMWSYNGWSLFWDAYYKNGQEIGSRYLYSATSRAVTVPAGQVAWFNVRASANNNGGYFGLVDMFITEQRA